MNNPDKTTKTKIETGIILPTWPKRTIVLKLEGQKELLVLHIDPDNPEDTEEPEGIRHIYE